MLDSASMAPKARGHSQFKASSSKPAGQPKDQRSIIRVKYVYTGSGPAFDLTRRNISTQKLTSLSKHKS